MKLKKIMWMIFILIMISINSLTLLNTNNLLPLYIVSLIIIIAYAIYGIPLFSSAFFFVSFYVMLFYTQPILHFSINDSLLDYPANVHKIYAFITTNGILLFLLGYSLLTGNIKNYKSKNKEVINIRVLNYFRNLLCILVFGAIGVVIIYIGPQSIILGSRLGLKQNLGLIGLVTNYIGHIASILIFLIFFSLKSNKKKQSTIMWILLFLVIEMFYLLLFRLRSFMVGHFSAVFMGMYFSSFFTIVENRTNSDEFINKLKLKIKKFKMIIALSGIFVGSIIFRFLRGYLEPGQNLANFDMNIKFFFERSIESGDLGYAPVVMQLISLVPDTYNYLLGQSYFRLVFVVIPRAIWENKPQNTQRIVASWLKPEIMGLTLPPGINGDSYINFGLLGIVVMMFFGIFFKSLDSKLTLKNVLIWGSSPVWIFHLVRGGFTNPLLIFIVLYTMNCFIAKRCNVKGLSDDLKS